MQHGLSLSCLRACHRRTSCFLFFSEADTNKFDEDVTSAAGVAAADGLTDPVEVVIVLVLFPVIISISTGTTLLPCLLLLIFLFPVRH